MHISTPSRTSVMRKSCGVYPLKPPRSADIRHKKMLRVARMAVLGKLCCGDVMSRQWRVWAVRDRNG